MPTLFQKTTVLHPLQGDLVLYTDAQGKERVCLPDVKHRLNSMAWRTPPGGCLPGQPPPPQTSTFDPMGRGLGTCQACLGTRPKVPEGRKSAIFIDSFRTASRHQPPPPQPRGGRWCTPAHRHSETPLPTRPAIQPGHEGGGPRRQVARRCARVGRPPPHPLTLLPWIYPEFFPPFLSGNGFPWLAKLPAEGTWPV